MYKIRTCELYFMEDMGDALYNLIARMHVYENYAGDISILKNIYLSESVKAELYDGLNVKAIFDTPDMGTKNKLELYLAHLVYKNGYTFYHLRDMLFPIMESINIYKYIKLYEDAATCP